VRGLFRRRDGLLLGRLLLCRLLLGGYGFLLAWPALADDPAATFQLEPQRPADRLVVESQGDEVAFDVTSASGIGRATIRPTKGRWPRQVRLRFGYATAGQAFETLEQFVLETPRLRVQGASKSAEQSLWLLPDPQGIFPQNDADPAGTVRLRAVPRGAQLELQLPRDLLRDSEPLRIEWIDFFRG